MLNLLAANIDGLEIAYIAVGVLLGIAIIAAFIAQIVIAIGYWDFRAESMRANFSIRTECRMYR